MKLPLARSRISAWLIGVPVKSKSSISLAKGNLARVSWYLIERACLSAISALSNPNPPSDFQGAVVRRDWDHAACHRLAAAKSKQHLRGKVCTDALQLVVLLKRPQHQCRASGTKRHSGIAALVSPLRPRACGKLQVAATFAATRPALIREAQAAARLPVVSIPWSTPSQRTR
jgi:hypothetical protein